MRQERSEPRFALRLGAAVIVRGERIDCILRDLSRMGACIEAKARQIPAKLIPGRSLILLRGALKVQARIAWARENRFGLAFDHPIRATELLLQMSEARGEVAPRA